MTEEIELDNIVFNEVEREHQLERFRRLEITNDITKVELENRRNLNIAQRINAIKKKHWKVLKDLKIEDFKWVSHDEVVKTLRDDLITFGILITNSCISSQLMDIDEKSPDGFSCRCYLGRYSIVFMNIDVPDDAIEIITEGMSIGHTDRLSANAATKAMKNATLKLFGLLAMEDEEEPVSFEETKTEEKHGQVTSDDLLKLVYAAATFGHSIDELLEHVGLNSLKEANQEDYKKMVDFIEKESGCKLNSD